MLRALRILSALLMPLMWGAPLSAFVNQNKDFQIWNHLGFEFTAPRQIWDKIDLKCKPTGTIGIRLNGETRIGNDASQLYLVYGQGQIFYANSSCDVAPGFRQTFSISSLGWIPVYMPMLDVLFFHKLCTWNLDDRNRVFFNIFEQAPSSWEYRNRLRFISPELSTCFKLKWFIFDETFFLERTGFYQNRLASGLFLTLTSHTEGTLQYTRRHLKVLDTWTYQNILFLQLSFRF